MPPRGKVVMYRWCVAQPSSHTQRFAETLGIHPLTAQVLLNRGIDTPEMAQRFLSPQLRDLHDPFLLPDMATAVARVARAVQCQERITIYGDYDVDGTCGTALLTRFLRAIGAVVDTYIPHREREGYGVHRAAIEVLRARGTQLIITVDTGTTAVDAVRAARTHGIEVIVTDHHEVESELPPATAVVNPKRVDSSYPFRELCGTGLAFKLLMALRQHLRTSGWFVQHAEPNLRALLDFVAVATIADVVPLIGENRTLAAIGLQQLARVPQCGFDALMSVAGVDRRCLDTYAIGFQIAPRLNAAGRMDDAAQALQLLLTDDRAEAQQVAQHLNTLNTERQRVENTIRTAIDQRLAVDASLLERSSIVMVDDQWPAGVVGIVASRIAETYRLPTIIIGFQGEVGRGSGRTVGAFPLLEAIRQAGEHLEAFGGHAAAAGLTVRRERYAAFAAAFDTAAQALLRLEHRERTLFVDAEIPSAHITLSLAQELARLEPFGLGNPLPLFVVRDVVVRERRIVGNNHLRLYCASHTPAISPGGQTFHAIGFALGDHPAATEPRLDLVFTPTPNTWNGETRVQLKVRDLGKINHIDTLRQ